MKKILCSIFCFTTFNVLAAGSGTGEQYVENVQITSSDHLRIKLSAEAHQSTCVSSGKETEMMVPANDPQLEHMMSIALTALTANKKIYIWIDNASCVEQYGYRYPKVGNISIIK